MKYNVKVTNKETKTTWHHEGLSREEVGSIQCNPNLFVEIKSEYQEAPRRYQKQWSDDRENE